MKKFFKMLFGRTTIFVLLILLQLVFILLTMTVLEYFGKIVNIIFRILSLVALVHLINRDMTPNGKTPWMILILLFPMTGTMLYVLFSQNKVKKKQYKFFAQLFIESHRILKENEKSQVTLESRLAEYKGQSRYLFDTSYFPLFTDTKTDYFPSGETFWKDLLAELKRAEKFIFVEYFIIEQGKMWDSVLEILKRKVSEGVEVRVMYDDIGCLPKIPSNYYKQLNKAGINCVRFNKFTPLATAVHNNRNHRKVTVIDGKTAYIGGMNLADEYINETHPFGYWKDSAVKLQGEAVKSFTVMFLQSFAMQTHKLEDFAPYIPDTFDVYPDEGYVHPFGDGPRPIYNDPIAEEAILNIINQSQRYLYITTPYLIIDDLLRSAIIRAARRGVDVRIITPQIPDKKLVFKITRYNYIALMEAGVKVYEFTEGFVHAKSIIADDNVGIVGTMNMDYRSLIHHYECGVWMYKTNALKTLKADLDLLMNHCELQTKCKLNKFWRFFCMVAMALTPLL
ncbi:MAG: cardiolipin synthase [Corallococcus sp.]|nr:cardiolipin synthase [Corallococcus sp.]